MALLAVLSIAVMAPFAAGCSSQQAPAAGANGGGSQMPPPLTESSVLDMVSNSFSDRSLVRRAAVTGEGTDKIVEIEADRPANWADGSFEGALSSVVQKTLPTLFEYPEVSKVVITIYGVDQGVRSDEIACRLTVDRATARKIDWSMVGPMTLSSILTEYYINPKILKNSDALSSGLPGRQTGP